MALSSYDKNNLTSSQQAGIAAATKAWNDANARGDTAGMAAAHAQAESIRNNAGYTSNASGAYSGSLSSGSGGGSDSYWKEQAARMNAGLSSASAAASAGIEKSKSDYQQQQAQLLEAQYQQQLAAQQAQSDALIKQLQEQYNGVQSQYAKALEEQKAAQEAAVNKAVNGLEGQKEDVSTAYSDLYRQAYIDKMNAQKNIDQRLAAQGVTGGAAESTLLGLNTAYSEALRKAEQNRIGALSDIDRAITDTRLTGDIEGANATASSIREQTDKNAAVLQSLINRYDALAARAQAYDREDAQRQEAYSRADASSAAEWARDLAMQMIAQGNMPDEETLAAAGMSATQARSLLPQVATGTYSPTFSAAQVLNAANTAAKSGASLSGNMLRDYNYYMYGDPDYGAALSMPSAPSASGGTRGGGVSYNNGGLDNGTVAEIQRAYGLDDDGFWGPNSQRLSGYASAAEALDALRKTAGTPEPLPTGGAMTSSELGTAAQNLYRSIASIRNQTHLATFGQRVESALRDGSITPKEADYLLSAVNY